ncbi:DNA-binding response regulator, NarL/FixJ family, contains REC and HTH domains [Arcanobacterium phocae]|uniref:DNA-binding response regulator, NarL/FixJ family, contains REC and HTH domains n=1 Tax=Arcanobacterium phocae TaxID=131112 RepID=A0A1H2LF52_9ACTO|nr:response regulator transcription factor [Arcanobacterium phocae]SDU79657.1 DNA-binding response regulator, NarL/FixJ family, contains REC and HTH domains [Arcanobacterium phocae]
MSLSVFIVDDHSLVRAGVRAQLEQFSQIEYVGEADSVDSAVTLLAGMAGESVPDVVLLDVHLPGGHGGGGAEVARRVLQAGVATRFLALSVSDAAEDVVAVIRAGARGYVTKAVSAEELVEAITRVAAGDAAFSPRLAGFVLDAFGAQAADVAERNEELDRLSQREQEVMRLIARGYTYRETAAELFISIKTVETHVSAVLRKLQLSNRYELSRWAAARGID